MSAISIVAINIPTSATPGQSVSVTMSVRNNTIGSLNVAFVAVESGKRFIDWVQRTIAGYSTASVSGSFIMPDNNTTVSFTALYWYDGAWRIGDTAERTVAKEAAPPPSPAFMKIISLTTPPTEMEPGQVFNFTVTIQNTGGQGDTAYLFIERTGLGEVFGGSKYLNPQEYLTANGGITMPDYDITFTVRAKRYVSGSYVTDSQMGPYTIKKKAAATPPFMYLIGVTTPPTEAVPGAKIDLVASIWNSGGTGGTATCMIVPTPSTPTTADSKYLAPGENKYFYVSLTMPSQNVSIMVGAYYGGQLHSEMGPYIIKVKITPGINNLNVGYAKV